MSRPRLLDLFCGAGGAAMGYHRAGFDVVGVDIEPQPNYPFEFWRFDAIELLNYMVRGIGALGSGPLGPFNYGPSTFDAIHASPPCQFYANVTRWRGLQRDHKALIEPTRRLLDASGLPYVIENVRTKALRPCLVLCGSMFGLPIRRHRGFETSWLMSPMVLSCHHQAADLAFEHKGERAYADAMGCDWMTAKEARQAIPPAYTEHIGLYLLAEISARAAA